jgi:hypothetical protein
VLPFQFPCQGESAGVEGAAKSNSVARSQLSKGTCFSPENLR